MSRPKPTLEANRCNLRPHTPKTPQEALYLGFARRGQPQQVVCFCWSRFQGPEARLAAVGKTNLRFDPLPDLGAQVAQDMLHALIDSNFKFYKKVQDDQDIARELFDRLFERYYAKKAKHP